MVQSKHSVKLLHVACTKARCSAKGSLRPAGRNWAKLAEIVQKSTWMNLGKAYYSTFSGTVWKQCSERQAPYMILTLRHTSTSRVLI